MARGFDPSRYFIKRIHLSTGLRVAMYKDDPGIYIDMKGNPVEEAIAAACGFDTVKYAKDRKRNQLLAEKQAEVDAHMKEIDKEIEAQIEAEVEASMPEPKPKEEPTVPPPAAEPSPFTTATEPPKIKITATNASGRPRETERRAMQGGQAGRWTVIDKESGEPIHPQAYVDTRTAESLLLEQSEVA